MAFDRLHRPVQEHPDDELQYAVIFLKVPIINGFYNNPVGEGVEMNKITLTLVVLIAAAVGTFAQIPNSGFEDWTTVGSYENPNGWATMNPACAGPFFSCTKSTDHYPTAMGNYSLRLENNTSLTQMTGAYGMAITDSFAYPFQPAFPLTGQPNTLSGYYKYASLNNDTMFIRIILFESGIMLGNNTFRTGTTTSNWTSFALPITYPSADSATIMFSAFYPSSQTDGPNGNSVLYVDNLSLSSLAVSVPLPAPKSTLFNISPNPAFNVVSLNIDNLNHADMTLNIYTAIGKLISSEPLRQNKQQIKVGSLPNGMYLVSVKSKSLSTIQKLVILR
jgi:hypothetical protein